MFSEQLKKLRNQKRLSQAKLANELNVSASTVAMWESGEREPKNYETLEIIADYFNVNIEVLLNGKLAPTRIPVLGKVVAGIPIEAIEEILDYEEIPQSMANNGNYFALQINGESMEPKFSNGDVVIVRKQDDVDNGDIAIVLVNGNDATVKKIKKFDNGINLIPTNPAYEVITYSNEAKIMNGVPAQIIEKYSVYSKETVTKMAEACRKTYNADVGIGVSGTMGNVDPANIESSVPGEVYFAIATKTSVSSYVYSIEAENCRLYYKLKVADLVYKELRKILNF